jgi:hypothetical protein
MGTTAATTPTTGAATTTGVTIPILDGRHQGGRYGPRSNQLASMGTASASSAGAVFLNLLFKAGLTPSKCHR